MSLRARTPSVERNPETSNKQLRFPRSNLPSTKNLTLLIKSEQSKTKTKHHEDYLPVEVVADGRAVALAVGLNVLIHTNTRTRGFPAAVIAVLHIILGFVCILRLSYGGQQLR